MLQLHQYVWFGSCLERISGMPTLLDLTTRTCEVFKRPKSTRLCLKRLWVWIDSPCSRHLYISTSTNASERLCKIISFFFCFLKQCFVLQIPPTIQNCSTLFRKDLKIWGLHLWWTNRHGDLFKCPPPGQLKNMYFALWSSWEKHEKYLNLRHTYSLQHKIQILQHKLQGILQHKSQHEDNFFISS